MTLLLGSLGLALLASAFVVLPILARRRAALGNTVQGEIVDAESRKRVALASLKEIEYDRVAGKLDDEDYRTLRARLEREALVAIEAVEAVHAGGGTAAPAAAAAAHVCGFVNPPGSRFCSGCGARLA